MGHCRENLQGAGRFNLVSYRYWPSAVELAVTVPGRQVLVQRPYVTISTV
jgi:hypothetical protein